jgi:hypothetical protein
MGSNAHRWFHSRVNREKYEAHTKERSTARARRRRALNLVARPVDDRGVLTSGATARQPQPTDGGAPPRSDDLFDRLRGAISPSAPHLADDLVEAVRRAMSREYERGYHDGWASTKAPRPQMPRPHSSHRFGRRMRRRVRAILASTTALRRAVFHLVLVLAVTGLATFVGLHLSNASQDSKYAPPPSNPK